MTTLEKITQNYITNIIDDLNYKGEDIFNKLILDKDSYVNSLPESLFTSYFLPFFIGTNNTNINWVLEWISIAGSPSMEVRVFNDNNPKETLYYVPPILDINNIMLANVNNNLNNIFTRYKMYNNNLPVEGTNYINKELHNKSNEFTFIVNKEYERTWFNILQRYNILSDSNVSNNVINSISNTDYLDF